MKAKGLITCSTDQQIFKFKVNSGTNQEVWGVYVDFKTNQSKWTIDAILQHMGFYTTTENPNVMMRENHNTQSYEYILYIMMNYILHQLHQMKFYTHYKTNIRSIFIYKINIHMILVEEIFVNVKSRNIL